MKHKVKSNFLERRDSLKSCTLKSLLFLLLSFSLPLSAYAESSVNYECVLELSKDPEFKAASEVVERFSEVVSLKKNQNQYDLQLLFSDKVFRGLGGYELYFALNHFKENGEGERVVSAGLYLMSLRARRALHGGSEEVYQVTDKRGIVDPVEPQFDLKVPADQRHFEFLFDRHLKMNTSQKEYSLRFSCDALDF